MMRTTFVLFASCTVALASLACGGESATDIPDTGTDVTNPPNDSSVNNDDNNPPPNDSGPTPHAQSPTHDTRPPHSIPEAERDYGLERRYPRSGNIVPRDIATRELMRMGPAGC